MKIKSKLLTFVLVDLLVLIGIFGLSPKFSRASISTCTYEAYEANISYLFDVDCSIGGIGWYFSGSTGGPMVTGDLMRTYARRSCNETNGDGSAITVSQVFPTNTSYSGIGTITFDCPGLASPYIDIGLRVKETSSVVHIAIENSFTRYEYKSGTCGAHFDDVTTSPGETSSIWIYSCFNPSETELANCVSGSSGCPRTSAQINTAVTSYLNNECGVSNWTQTVSGYNRTWNCTVPEEVINTPSSKLRIVKNGQEYFVALVPVTDVNASKVRVKLSDGTIKALRTCTPTNNCTYVP